MAKARMQIQARPVHLRSVTSALPPEPSTAFPVTVPPCYKLRTTKSNEVARVTAKIRTSTTPSSP